jgi:hypothetical protein
MRFSRRENPEMTRKSTVAIVSHFLGTSSPRNVVQHPSMGRKELIDCFDSLTWDYSCHRVATSGSGFQNNVLPAVFILDYLFCRDCRGAPLSFEN